MGSVLDYFSDWKAEATMQVEEPVTVVVSGKATTTWTAVDGLTALRCWTSQSRAVRQFVGDKFKTSTGLTIIVDPADLGGTKLTGKMRGVIDGRAWYFNEPDNVLAQGEVIVILADGVDHA
jgi:predicted phage tail protein